MHIRAVMAVQDLDDIDSTARYVLVTVATRANQHTGELTVSIDKLAAWTGLHYDTVSRTLTRLAAAGRVVVVHKPGNWSTLRLPAELTQVTPRAKSDHPPRRVGPTPRAESDHPPRRVGTEGEVLEKSLEKNWKKHARTESNATDNLPAVIKPKPAATPPVDNFDGFGTFWQTYPRKVAKAKATAAYRRAANRDDPHLIAAGVERWSTWWDTEGTDGRYIPHAATWLNEARYLEDPGPGSLPPEPKGFAGIREYLEGQPRDETP